MLNLQAQKRDMKAKAGTLRKEGMIPAVFYGRKAKTTPIAIKKGDFDKVWREAGETTVVTLDIPEGKVDALIHDVQFDPITDAPAHIDFYVIEAGQEIEVGVPLEFVGVAPAVKELGGILVKVLHEVEVKAPANKIPHEIQVDISSLGTLESLITIGDLKFPSGVTPMLEATDIVASIAVAKEEEEAPTTIDMSAIEVEKKGKKEEEEIPAAEGEKK
jgi:large subunit ribosomal protein L25